MYFDIKDLIQWTEKGGKIAIFCAGQNGYIFYKILQLLEIKVDCFVDNNKEKWNQKVYDDVFCYPPEILRKREEYVTYICISPEYYGEVLEQAHSLEIVHIENIKNVFKEIAPNYWEIYKKLLMELPYGKKSEFFYELYPNRPTTSRNSIITTGERIAVYTGIFGDYDAVWEPQYFSENIDYYFISEEKPVSLKGYNWIDAKNILPPQIEGPILKNRYIKMHPHLLFPEYKYSVYIDGNVQIVEDISALVQSSKTGIAVFGHPYRSDIFVEALAVVNAQRANPKDVYNQMYTYMKEGMPSGYGLPEMRVIAREHGNPICIKVMEAWWSEFIKTRSYRDQLSFMYVMWENGLRISDLCLLGEDMGKCDSIIIYHHNK